MNQLSEQELKAIRELIADKMKPKFNVGDWVKVIKSKCGFNMIGCVYKISEYKLDTINGHIYKINGWWFSQDSLKPAFKVGDWVEVVRKVTDRSKHWQNIWDYPMDRYLGHIYQIEDIDYSRGILLEGYRFPPDSLELAEKPVEKKKVIYEFDYFQKIYLII